LAHASKGMFSSPSSHLKLISVLPFRLKRRSGLAGPTPVVPCRIEVHPSRSCGGRAIPLLSKHIISSEGAHQFIAEPIEL
ncbi:hypothetical protein PIB30_063902, partial [Stylosanthes scabra]|nr:hypothetical protein [Stylosanthes scabra]